MQTAAGAQLNEVHFKLFFLVRTQSELVYDNRKTIYHQLSYIKRREFIQDRTSLECFQLLRLSASDN